MWGNLSQLVYLTPHPRLWRSDCVQIMKMTFKCYISENDGNFLISKHFLLVYNNQSLEMPLMTGVGQPIPAGLSYPYPRLWRSDCVQKMKMTFKCYISENDENTLLFRLFLLVYNKNITYPVHQVAPSRHSSHQQPVTKIAFDGWGATYPSWFNLPPTDDFRLVTSY